MLRALLPLYGISHHISPIRLLRFRDIKKREKSIGVTVMELRPNETRDVMLAAKMISRKVYYYYYYTRLYSLAIHI